MFLSIFDSDLPPEEKAIFRLTGEGSAILAAGTETTSWALTVMTYYLLTQPDVLRRLTAELSAAVPDPHHLPSWSALEQLPYLGAVVQEGLRLSYGVSSRTARIPTEEDLTYHGVWTPPGSAAPVELDFVVPRGSAIGMSSSILHHNEDVFPDSHSFIPERWLDENGQRRKDLERCMLSFGRGSRQCLGMKYDIPPPLQLPYQRPI